MAIFNYFPGNNVEVTTKFMKFLAEIMFKKAINPKKIISFHCLVLQFC